VKIVVAIYSEFRSWCIPEVEVERLRAEFPEHTFVRADDDAATLAAILSADVAFSSRITAGARALSHHALNAPARRPRCPASGAA